jgi:arylsulfatase A-like enzyme
MENTNVILICIDGGRLDRARNSKIFKTLESKGVFLSQTITYAPYTNSAIHAMISGAYGIRNGCYSYWHSIKFKKFQFKTLSQYLQENGFITYADVHSKLVLPEIGFDKYNIYDEENVDLSNRHSDILHELSKKNKNFFLYLHFSNIHTGIRDEVLKVYDNFSEDYFENVEKNNQRYDDLFSHAEKYIEKISNELTNLDLWKNSIVLIFSDHGISIGEKFGERAYGAFCYDYTIKTFSYYLSSLLKNKEIPDQVRHVDFLPTILEHLKIKTDNSFEKFDGVSLVPLLSEKPFEEQFAYTETANPLHEKAPPKKPNTKSVRTSKWKLIVNEYNNSKELYNLENDPNELKNLIGKNLEIETILLKEFNNIQQN